jgi:hypothetical protein
MSKILSEKDLVDQYINQKIIPYDFDQGDEFEYFKEFPIKAKNESRRIDLIIYNKTKGRTDLIEFKNRPINPNDFLQISNYFYLFLNQHPIYEGHTYSHLIGKPSDSNVVKSIISVGFEKLHVWYFWGSNDIEVYKQDRNLVLLCDL